MQPGRKRLSSIGWSLQRATNGQSPTSVSGHLVLFRPRTVSSQQMHERESLLSLPIAGATRFCRYLSL